MLRPTSRSWLLGIALLAVTAAAVWAQVVRDGPLPAPLPLFPRDNWWNVDITNAPVDPNSDEMDSSRDVYGIDVPGRVNGIGVPISWRRSP